MIDIQIPLSTMDATATTYPSSSGDLAMVLNESYIPSIRSKHTPQVISRMLPSIAPRPLLPGIVSPSGETADDSYQPSDRHQIYLANGRRRKLDLTEEDKFLLELREEERLPWKVVAARFKSDRGKVCRVPALQMRLKRIKERVRVSEWPENDLRALRMSHDHWAQNKFEIIANRMTDFGVTQRWTAQQCARKWQEFEYDSPPPCYSTAYEGSPMEHGLGEESAHTLFGYDRYDSETVDRVSQTSTMSDDRQWSDSNAWREAIPAQTKLALTPLYSHEPYLGLM